MEIKQVIEKVNREEFVYQENGKQLPQTTATRAIENGLHMLDIQEGHRILEIGTGSGFSTALLANLVGSQGEIVSVDIDPDLTKRAQKKLASFPQVTLVTRDGREGVQTLAPYDRIIAWTTPTHLPNRWKEQVKENGLIVTPFRVLPIAQSTVMVRLKKVDGELLGDLVGAEGYIMMTSEPVINFYGPEIHADMKGIGEESYWAGSMWMKQTKRQDWGNKFINNYPQSSPFQENGKDIRAYLLGSNPDGYTYAFHPEHGFWLGYSSPDGFALISYHNPNQWMITDENHADVLRNWFRNWEELGKPSYEQLHPIIERDQIRVKLKGGDSCERQ